MGIAVDAQLTRESDATGLNRRGTGLDQCVAASRDLPNPVLIEFRCEAVRITLLVGERCQHEPVSHGRAMQESQRLEQI